MVGLGISGYWAARWLAEKGARVSVSDMKEMAQLDPTVVDELQALGVTLETGGHREETFLNADAIILSPGAPHDTPLIRTAIQKQIPVMGEMELATRYIDAPMIGVTGTNGKTTVTSFLGQLLETAGYSVFVGGNIGTPLTAYLAQEKKADYLVVEVSSFQLDTIRAFSPLISIILNISPDHLDRYPNYGAYIQSKLRIYENQGPGQTVILNDDDPELKKVSPSTGARVFRYGLEKKEGRHAYLDEGGVFSDVAEKSRFNLNAFSLAGSHNLENLLAAVLAGRVLGLEPRVIQETIDTFKGLPNRLEFTAKIENVLFFNDSKATNVDAAIRAVQSFDGPLILIAGGRHKGSNYHPLLQAARGKVKKAVFMGEAANLLAEAFTDEIPFSLAADMQDAVSQAFSGAENGDTVLLAPACASFDMFRDYDHRGKAFKSAVRELSNGH